MPALGEHGASSGGDDYGNGNVDDPMEKEEGEEEEEGEESRGRRLEDRTVKCETPGCDNGHFQLGVCYRCFSR